MLQQWSYAKGLLKRLHVLAAEAPQPHVLGDSGWSSRETLPHKRLACGQTDGPPLGRALMRDPHTA
ncbi:hypothetical protein ABH944_004289 [Caballeronia udeis]|uniref:Uncharacterized protein n=1 Tax=Caballeronia udeis TaxID=1232866 RepID=A0ABW8MN79_9BURK